MVTRRFLGWQVPLVQAVASHLSVGWAGSGVLDLSDTLVIVPTRHASRRLREGLATHAAARGAAVLPPLVVTPDFLTAPERLPDIATADRVETLLIWAAQLLQLDLDGFRHLFPVDPVERSFHWALKTAGDLLEVRETLNESGLSLADVARLLADTEMEPERWRDLAAIENRCVSATEDKGFADRQSTRRRAATHGRPPEQVQRIVLASVLDPSALAIATLERWSRLVPVEVLVYAPETSHREFFDEWGRPVPEAWLKLPIDIAAPNETIHASSTPAEQAERAVELLAAYEDPCTIAAIGVADAEVTGPLVKSLARAGLGGFDPAGQSLATHGVFHLLRLVSQLAAGRSFQSVAEFIRCPDAATTILQRIEQQTGVRPSLQRLLDDLDTLAVTALPDTLDDAMELAPRALGVKGSSSPVPSALAWLNDSLKALAGRDFSTALTDLLSDVFAARQFHQDRPQDVVFAAIAEQITEVLEALEGPAAAAFPGGLDASQRLELLLQALSDQVFYAERMARDIDLQGWLELLWEDAPHLIVTGMNDGKVPEALLGHRFLPDSARRALGLRHNDHRFARDACLMTCLIASRAHGGRVDFVFGRTGSADEPLRPSRLLFQCPEMELPSRTLQFFEKPPRRADPMPWQLAWRLLPSPLPDEATVFSKLSVTQLRDYLLCPFRFYLRHGLRMEEVDVTRTEMDAREFGSLMHHVLEEFAKDEEAANSRDTRTICAVFHSLLDRRLHAIYGRRLTVPVTIQRESARQRLAWWAEIEAQERTEGWRIIAAETRISPEGNPWTLGGMMITGVVDRVERHERHGIRLVDFKTYSPYDSKKGARRTVEEYHVAAIKRTQSEDDFPSWSLTRAHEGSRARWTDLQLPLYRLAMERCYPGESIVTAHATLGKTQSDIGLDPWPQLEGALLESARVCAEGVVASVGQRLFWPPVECLPYRDNFGALFFGNVLTAVDPSLLIAAQCPCEG
ncbi:MAG: PD-(D/E)XK nuclease family protein [Roseimicrobium sp.]